jgi:hypothetical protein
MKSRLKRTRPIDSTAMLVTLAVVAVVGVVAVSSSLAAKPAGSGHGGGGTPAPTAAQLSISPAKATVAAGQTLAVQVHTNSGTATVNAVQADFSYPADKLTYVKTDDTGSGYPVSAVETASAGMVSIARGATTPVSGDQLVATVYFTAAKSFKGGATLSFLPTSALVTSDTNQNIITATAGATYSFAK